MDSRHQFDVNRMRCVRCGCTREQMEDGDPCQVELERAMTALNDATDSRGLRVHLWSVPTIPNRGIDLPEVGQSVLDRIHELTDGFPLDMRGDQTAAQRNHGRNLQLLLNVYTAWVEEMAHG